MATNEADSNILKHTETDIFHPDSSDQIVHYLDYWDAQSKINSKGSSFTSGLQNLDLGTQGFQTGELIVLSGPTANGKTLFVDTLMYRLMREVKQNIALFSYEVSTKQFIEKYVNLNKLYGEQFGLFVPTELKVGDVKWLKSKCIEARVKNGCKIVVIDHLHFIVDMKAERNMSLNIGAVMRQIKQDIAVRMDMLVFIIAHQGQPERGAEPSMDNIRDSSFISQEADTVFVVYRTADPVPPELENNAKIKGYPQSFDQGFCAVKIEKARRAGTYRKRLNFQKQGHWLEEV